MRNPELIQNHNDEKDSKMRELPSQHLEEVQKSAETLEKKERPEKVMELAKEKRAEQLKQVVLSRAIKFCQPENLRVVLKLLNNIPYVGDVNLWKGAVTGKEAGKKLTAGERFNYVAAGTASALSLISLYEGNLNAAAIEQGMAYVFVNIDTIPYTLKKSAEALGDKAPKLAHMMNTVADYVIQKREDLVEMGKSLTDSSLTSLNLKGEEA